MTVSARYTVTTADQMRSLGHRLGLACAGGDVVVLIGDLGAGKTTITQGIALGLGIAEAITSPTFVIARVHANAGEGPDLVHVDAYRLGSLVEVDDLDLESDLERSVMVVEWGEGMVDGLSSSRLVVRLSSSEREADETRTVDIVAEGGHWTTHDLEWAAT